jgi:proteasome activator subunit 4
LDWRPLYKELKVFVLPNEVGQFTNAATKRNVRTLTKLCSFAQLYFDPTEVVAMFEDFLPFFNTSFAEGAYVVVGLLNLLLPTSSAPEDRPDLHPQHYLPTFFHLWSLVNRSKLFDVHFIDLLSRMARDSLTCSYIPFSAYGIFTEEQSSQIFTAILRVLEIPVGQSNSPYSSTVDLNAGLAALLDRDPRKHPIAHHIARWIVMSLSPACLDKPNSILANLEGLIQAVETFFHPSNSGAWTRQLSMLVYFLADFFVMRWNRERSGEMDVPDDRKLNGDVKHRFVLCLRDVVFMGIYSKSGTAMNHSLSALQSLAYLEPDLILPGALQRIYPAMQGLVEVHRTISSIRALQMLAKVMVRSKGYRCHITTLLGLALPGIDANDLEKTMHTLAYIQAIAYNIPFHDLAKEDAPKVSKISKGIDGDDQMANGTETPATERSNEDRDSGIAMRWITEQVDRLEKEGAKVEINYENELTDHEEEMILRSSTTDLAEFVISFIGRVFTLLENLPDASRVRSGSPEENVVNTLPATLTPLLAALSPELYDIALEKIANFVTNHVIHQARDAMAFICNALVKVSPRKALQRLLPEIIAAIRTEITDNGAGSTRTTGSEVYPRDRALVWNISLLSMCVVHVGEAVMDWKQELFDVAAFMQDKCRGIPTVHVSNFIHHLLLNLTLTYTVDFSIFEPENLKRGLTTHDWGRYADAQKLTVKWHKPSQEEVCFAIELFKSQVQGAIKALKDLTSEITPVKREGTGKDWSDEVSRNLVLIRLIISGISVLFDPRHERKESNGAVLVPDGTGHQNGSKSDTSSFELMEIEDAEDDEDESSLGEDVDEEVRPTFQYETGYPLVRGSPEYEEIHDLREMAGETLHKLHEFLVERHQDDVQCFNALYNAYRSWLVDVGIERSAHVLDRVTRLLQADIHPFKFSGLRKEYPRPLLIRRANVYHLQRLRHNAHVRPRSPLETQLLLDLTQSSVSMYTEIRRTAQSAGESAVKCVIGARPLVIPPLLDAFEKAIKEQDNPRIKGAMYSLLFGSLAKTISRDWRFTPRLIKGFIEVTVADKPSIQKLAESATYQVMDIGKPFERMVIMDQDYVEAIAPKVEEKEAEEVIERIAKRRKFILKRRSRVEEKKAKLAVELVDIARTSHWKKARRTALIAVNLGVRFEHIASNEMIDLLVAGSIDSHPSLRGIYSSALVGLYGIITVRSLCKHDYKRFLLMEESLPDKMQVPTRPNDPSWNQEFLASFAKPNALYYVDYEYPGWLVWNKTMPAFKTSQPPVEYDELEKQVRNRIGKALDRHWFSTFFAYMKQEPRDHSADRFRMSVVAMLTHAFELVFAGVAVATVEDIKDLTQAVYGDGTDKHQHRATAEILGALLADATEVTPEQRTEIWDYVFPIVRNIFKDGLTPENSGYWTTFLHIPFQAKDPRRAWPLLDWLASFKLDMSSSAAFKESSKIHLLNTTIMNAGWHFQLDKTVLEDFLSHLDHPYKAVREAMGQTISTIYRTRYYEAYPDINSLIHTQKDSSSIGVRPYEPSEEFTKTITEVFEKLEQWRKERKPGQQTPSSYTQAGKTVLLWIDQTLTSFESTQLVKFFPSLIMEQLLHMMDIKEDPELQSLAYLVFRHMPNIPHRAGEDADFIAALIRIGRTSISWHQRLRVLLNIQVLYFRRLFLMTPEQQRALFDCVSAMLSDVQLEVRIGAAATLSGMIRCSPVGVRDKMIHELKDLYTTTLRKNPLPKRVAGERISTPTPEQNRLVITRHGAVLGLGALVQAFPYTSPPPSWLPEVLATLALKAAGDPGIVGKGVKQILADFKKTRQDTWHVDVKVRNLFRVLLRF